MSFLQIGSWNIEHLSGSGRGDKKQSAYALADYIQMAGVDMMALQEIYVTPANEEVRLSPNQPVIASRAVGQRRNSDLDIVCYLLEEHLDVAWSYMILPNRNPGDTSQLCAVMWNTGRLTAADPVCIAVAHEDDGDHLWDRAPHAIRFTSPEKVWRRDADGEWHQVSESKSFALIPLHMKSNYGGVTKNRRVRHKEAKTLCAQLDHIRATVEPSLVLIGDTNILRGDEPAIDTYVDHGLIDLNNNDCGTFWSAQYGESPFDRAFVEAGRPEFRYSRQYVLKSADLVAHDRLLSDHFMIKISVKIYLDDADPRPAIG